EAAVVRYLEDEGYQIVGTNLRLGHLELDIVARRDSTIAVVEVRTRGTGAWTTAFGSMDAKKRLRIRRAGERLWQRRYRNDPSVERLRFDAAAVTFEAGEPRVEYVVAAF
ncbi:MAG TPA: YraN family protein, partial [Polyangiaceae bacterium]|nr:YraN family protein [Polyangiaceae bacterium]